MAMIYATCARCGKSMFGPGRALSTGRRVCVKCYEEVVFELKRDDDGATHTWQETKERTRQLATQHLNYRPRGYRAKLREGVENAI